jgi:hypothetical protein
MVVNGSKLSPKIAVFFHCKKCDYNCSKQSEWDRHILTRKHQNGSKMVVNDSKKRPEFICPCGKSYKWDSGFYRHKKKCSFLQEENIEKSQPTSEVNELFTQKMVETVISHNKEFMTTFINKMMETMPQLGNNSHNNNTTNSHNNTFNINMFLNEHCKNAMNLTDFIQSLPITNKTYDDTIENGLTNTITNMMVNGLNKLDILERPIHCTDTKRKTIYVKESDFWEKDKELNKILNGIKEIASKHRLLIDKWQDANEGWDTNENIQTRLTTLIYNVMTDVENSEKETKKIINAIGKNVYLDEDIKGEYKNVVNNEAETM